MSVDAENKRRSADEVRAWYRGSPRKYAAYLSGDGQHVTTWMGDILAVVTRSRTTARRGFYGSRTTTTYINAVDDAGRWWSGRGPGRNMYIRLTRIKGPRD